METEVTALITHDLGVTYLTVQDRREYQHAEFRPL